MLNPVYVMNKSYQNPIGRESSRSICTTEKPSHLVEFSIDCWENVFDNLSLRDILVMSQTCQQMCKIGGYYFRKHFPGLPCDIINNEEFFIRWFKFNQTDFLRFVDALNIFGPLFNYFNPLPNVHLYRSLTKLNLCFIDLTESHIYGIKDILSNVESVQLYTCKIFEGFFEHFIPNCPKIKCLSVNRVVFNSSTAANGLFSQRCNNLQYFQYIGTNQMSHTTGALKTFLTQNSNLNYLEMDAEDLWLNRFSLIGLNIRLDYLAVKIKLDEIMAISFGNLLKVLHMLRFYKKFHATVEALPNWFDFQEFIDGMIGFDAFEQIHTIRYVKISRVTQLKEIYVSGNRFAGDMERLAKSLTQLERLHICGARIQFIMPFMRHTKTLNTILMISDLNEALDIAALNREREKLKLAQKVTIGVCERVYLATKRKFGQINWSLVKIVREESISFDHINKYLQ